jgi:Tfp pilus assembly protein PilW
MAVTGKGEAAFVMHTFYREPRQAGKTHRCKSGGQARLFWRDLQIRADFGPYIIDVVDKCAGRRFPALACGELAAVLR